MSNKLSFIIINYKTPEVTLECVESIKSNINSDFEIIVVDNNSQDNSKEYLLSKFGDIKWVSLNNNYGYGYAVNRGFEKSEGNYIVVLNSDIIIKNDFSIDLIEKYEEYGAGCFGIELRKVNGKKLKTASTFPTIMTVLANEIKLLRKMKRFRRYTQEFSRNEKAHKVDWVTGAFLFISRDIFSEIFGFDESFFMYYEDIDFCHKICDKGYGNYYLTNYYAVHKHNYSVRKEKQDCYNFYQVAEKKSAINYIKKYYRNKFRYFLIFYYSVFFYKLFENLFFLTVLSFIQRKRKKHMYRLRTYYEILKMVK